MNQVSDDKASWTWRYRNVSIYLKLDSKNRVYSYRFKAPLDQEVYFKSFKSELLDRALDELKTSFLTNLLEKGAKDKPYLLLKSAYQLKEAIKALTGDVFYSSVNPHQIVCRCAGEDDKSIRESFNRYKGDLKTFVRESGVSMSCGGCRESFKLLWQELSHCSSYIGGKTLNDFLVYINDLLIEYYGHTHLEINPGEIKLDYVEVQDIYLKTNSKISTKLILTSLENFFYGNKQLSLRVHLSKASF